MDRHSLQMINTGQLRAVALWSAYLLTNAAAYAAPASNWQLLRPIGGHFSVRVPKLVNQSDLPSSNGVKMRSWTIVSGANIYTVVAMYSANSDFKSLIADPANFQKRIINGFTFQERTAPRTKDSLPIRTLFHCSKNHAVMISESAPQLPSINDQFFKSIEIEENRVVPMKTINHTKSGLSFLFPSEFKSEDGYWTGQDNDNNYAVEVAPVEKMSETEQLKYMQDFADRIGTKRSNDKITKVQGCRAREFCHGNGKFMIIVAPSWSYTFACIGADDAASTIKARDGFFKSIAIKPL